MQRITIRQMRYSCSSARAYASAASQRPILYHYIAQPVPYLDGLRLQEAIVARRLQSKAALLAHVDGTKTLSSEDYESHTSIAAEDVLLLLQHTPVYTTGRRDTDENILKVERERLTALGADYIATQRGGQTTYHGPGQLVGYPIVDTAGLEMSTREYVGGIATFLEKLLVEKLRIPLLLPPPHVGAYPSATTKIASIGIQIRHRITSHGFALNVTDDVKFWFDKIIACGSPDIKATSIESELRRLARAPTPRKDVIDVLAPTTAVFGDVFKRKMVPLEKSAHSELQHLVKTLAQGSPEAEGVE